jgi:hypothetical protein
MSNPNSQLDPQNELDEMARIASNETFCRDWYELKELEEMIQPKD